MVAVDEHSWSRQRARLQGQARGAASFTRRCAPSLDDVRYDAKYDKLQVQLRWTEAGVLWLQEQSLFEEVGQPWAGDVVPADFVTGYERTGGVLDQLLASALVSDHSRILDDDQAALESFEDLEMDEDVLRGLFGFASRPGPEHCALPRMLQGQHLACEALPGDGRLSTVAAGLLARVGVQGPTFARALVVMPTEYHVFEFQDVLLRIGQYVDGFTCLACVGGSSLQENMEGLSEGPAIVLGTAGRLADLVARGHLQLSALECLVLEEASELVARGFSGALKQLLGASPASTQICLFSSEIFGHAEDIVERHLRSTVARVRSNIDGLSFEGLRQFYIVVEPEPWMGCSSMKLSILQEWHAAIIEHQAVIFCASERTVEVLAERLLLSDFLVSTTYCCKEFLSGRSRVLITTHHWARSIVRHGSPLVINYDVPRQARQYLSCVGRSASRFGFRGVALTFATEKELPRLSAFEQYFGTQIEELPCNLSSLL